MKQTTLFSNRCPQCLKGRIFKWGIQMNANCESCGRKFENEEGHFLGAMIIAYFINAFLAVPTLLWCNFVKQYDLLTTFLLVGAQLAATTPVLYRWSKVVWIQLEFRLIKNLGAGRQE